MANFYASAHKLGGENEYVSEAGFYTVVIDGAYRDDVQHQGGTFYKYTIDMVVTSGYSEGKKIKGSIAKSAPQWEKEADREWGGWNSAAISKYAIAAGLDKSGVQIDNVKQLCEHLDGEKVIVEVFMKENKQGKSYATVIDVLAYNETASAVDDFIEVVSEEVLPF